MSVAPLFHTLLQYSKRIINLSPHLQHVLNLCNIIAGRDISVVCMLIIGHQALVGMKYLCGSWAFIISFTIVVSILAAMGQGNHQLTHHGVEPFQLCIGSVRQYLPSFHPRPHRGIGQCCKGSQ